MIKIIHMKNLTQYVNEAFSVTEIGRKTVSGSWEDGGKKIASNWKSIPKELKTILEDTVYEEIENFYANTPKKRNVASMVMINVKMEIGTDPLYAKLKNLYKKIGMDIWMHEFPKEICSGTVSGNSTSREGGSDRTKIRMNEKFYNSWRQIDRLPGNGYNNLPGELIEEYRIKLLSCISGSEIVVNKDMTRNVVIKAYVPCYNVTYNAIFDKAKVKALIDEIHSNMESEEKGTLGGYAKSLAITNNAIDKYYASKRTGDYIGD